MKRQFDTEHSKLHQSDIIDAQ
jgi:hypothetical protein